jgi:guanylate kinase
LIHALVARRADLEVAVSATTRTLRPGEVDGREYYFLSEGEFVRLVEQRAFLEHVVYVGHRYGTLRSEVERIFSEGKSCVLELETRGARAVKEEMPESVTIFVSAPSFDELARRLRERATESSGDIGERLEVARGQMDEAGDFDHVVVNDDVGRAVGELENVVDAALKASDRLSPT